MDAVPADPLGGEFRTAGIQPLSLPAETDYIAGGESFAADIGRRAGNMTRPVDRKLQHTEPASTPIGSGLRGPPNSLL